uniref:Ovostatin n=1 Tax=Castor canadensis TaxID=51338 RepID=A0A8C0WKS1_CASCN
MYFTTSITGPQKFCYNWFCCSSSCICCYRSISTRLKPVPIFPYLIQIIFPFSALLYIQVPQKSSKELGFVTLLAKGATLKFYEKRSVAIVSEENVTFVQTDKPIYKPGDPQHNVIFQWQNVTSFRNITQLSFQLTSEPIFGDYTIVVKSKSRMTQTHQFTVNRNVLPKFEVKYALSTRYTYGQFVQGKAQIRVCRKFFALLNCAKDNNEICEQFIVQLSYILSLELCDQMLNSFLKKTSIFITSLLGSVSFKNVDPFYRRGISYFGTLKFRGPNNVPMVSKLLQLEQNDKFVGNYTTDENGEAQFSIDTSDIFDPQFNLKATYVQPPSCYLPSWLTPEYSDAHLSVSRFYSRTNSFLKIVPESKQLTCNQQKIITVLFSLNSEAYKGDSNVNFFYLVTWNGNFSFPITISADLAPLAVVLVYTIHPSGEIVADRVKFQIEKCFKNKVSIKFSKEQALPGSNSNLYLQAAPDSSCALRAVDQSVLLLKPEQELSAESVYNQLPSTRLYGYFYHGLNLDGSKVQPCIPQKNMFHDGLYYMPISNNEDGDIYDIVKQVNYVEQTIKETVRTNFPETWIWDLVSIDSSGSANLSFRIPDTITQWKAKAFCVNGDSGFGISSTVSLPVSQSFFVEIASPFSVVRNEQCDLIVNVFSYLNTCVEFNLYLGYFPGKANITVVAESKQSSTCPNEATEEQTLNWKDTVVKDLLVEVGFLGDILGVAMQNLENLLQMPYGCGEQNIALLASDTYILDYLRTTGQLTEEIKNKAVFLLSTGYQKILSLKNSDGSYRMLWQKNQKGSIWLSALSFKTLNRMKKYVFVEEAVQKQTLIWLASQQDRDGCFRNNGKIFTNFPVLRNGVFCLEEAVERGVMNGYTHAILAYTFALAGKEEQVESSLQILDQSAIKINNMIYWKRERKLKQDEPPSFIPWALSGETEKTCYVLLAVISRKTQDLAYASRIVQWLAQQTNSHGGFSATQVIDRNLTVIALCLTFSNDHNNITFRSEESSQIFEINRDNRLLVQRSELAKAHGEYTVDVEGQGCVVIFFLNFRYTGIHENSNMVIVDVKMLSGFTPVLSSIEKVSDIATNFTFSVEQTSMPRVY